MTLPFAVGESSTGYPFSCQERSYSCSSEEGSRVDPRILSEASDAAAMASAFRARNDLYACGSMHHKAARCYFQAAEALQSDPVTRAGIMLLCHSHATRAKEFEDMNNSVTGASKGKGMKMQERLEKEQASAATQKNDAENVTDSMIASQPTKLSGSSLTVSPAELGRRKVISSAEDLLELERHLDLLGMKPISVTTNSSSSERANSLDDAAAPSHKQGASSLSTAQYLSSTLGESFYLLPESILISKTGGPHHPPHFMPIPESSSMCKETLQIPKLGGDTMATKEDKLLFRHSTRRILPESWKRENDNNSSTHLEKNSSGGGEAGQVVQGAGGGGGDHYTTAKRLNNDTSAEITRLLARIQRLSNENVSLLRERESVKAIYECGKISQGEMADFKAQYRAKYAELRSALEEFRQQNAPNQPSDKKGNVNSLTRRVASLEAQLQREKALSRKKDVTIKQFSNFYEGLKVRATRKQNAAAEPHNA